MDHEPDRVFEDADERLSNFAGLAARVFLYMGLAFLALYKLPGLIRGLNMFTRIAEGKIDHVKEQYLTDGKSEAN